MPSNIFGVNSELVVNICVGVALVLVLAVPIFDRRASRELPSPVFTAVGVGACAYMAIAILLAYLT